MTAPARRNRLQRVGAYALCVDEETILLSRFAAPDGRWGPPGGGVEHGEDPADTVVREALEETGYEVRVGGLLGVRSSLWSSQETEVHALHLVYRVMKVGGTLRHEVGGSSDRAGWFRLGHLTDLRRTDLLDAAMNLYRALPSAETEGQRA